MSDLTAPENIFRHATKVIMIFAKDMSDANGLVDENINSSSEPSELG
ncbi:MAG TPA: hypothetical protein VFI73_03865 [Candidatus Nitrosopolaris sp.]|nr:hypothetical protein [Candidatus Nitrosopolaris sp.]